MSWRRKASTGSQSSWTNQKLEAGTEKPDRGDRESDWEDEDDSPSSYGSRVTSGSSQPMLSRATSAYSRQSKKLFLWRIPASITRRWLCIALTSIMFFFILSLFRASWSSARRVEVELQKGSPMVNKPPPWESFPFLERYYGGLRALVDKSSNIPEYPSDADEANPEEKNKTASLEARDLPTKPLPPGNRKPSVEFNPYPQYTSEEYTATYGKKVDCFLDEAGKIKVPSVRMYPGVPEGMPEAVMGSNSLLGIRDDVCFDRFGRLGPYGLGYSLARGGSGASLNGDREGADEVWSETPEVKWEGVRWADIQNRCVKANAHRFQPLPDPKIDRFRAMQIGPDPRRSKREEPAAETVHEEPKAAESPKEAKKLPRTAVIIRTWSDFKYTTESVLYLRALISELSLQSGGEYQVHFLVHVKDDNLPIWSDDGTYERVLKDSLPEEFRGMGTLWTERQMLLMYGGLQETMMRDLPVHGVYRSTFMPMQYFAYSHPEYDFFWNWEMDARYTGHWYHLFDSVSKWAKDQPRKNLWERNSRFYIPSEHGTWEDFRHMVRVQTDMGTDSPKDMWAGLKSSSAESKSHPVKGDKTIWGPEPILDNDVSWDQDVQPPTTYAKDEYAWGVGEEADLITFNPLFDPEGTTWLLAEDVTGYNTTRGLPPRRVAIITASRLSRRLLLTMHHETSINHHTMFSEMWPASCALHHGLKAVYAPHSEYIDRKWPTHYLASVFNGGKNGATGGARTSVFGDREHNFRGTTWYYNAGFPEVLWHRWLGYKMNNDGGEEWEVSGEGRMCLPAMLLHPIKRVDLVQEGRKAEDWNGGAWNE